MMTGVKVYDTLSRSLREIEKSNDTEVRIYCCGPTVYRDAHLGNLRTFLLSDIVRRTLEFKGHRVRLVQNITDVGHMSEDFDEDKLLSESRSTKRDPYEIAREFEAKFHRDLELLGIIPADRYPRASECIEMMHDHIQLLMDKGLAYLGDDKNVYFSSEKFQSYGAISGNRLSDLKPGHRFEFTEAGAKRFHADWALWKSAGNRKEMIWDSPWGPGFPGWHIECSAMSLHFLDGHVDLHIGGIDLRFPHHENERAQSNPIANPIANPQEVDGEAVDLWLHGEHLLFEGRKMSKSAGNVVLLTDVITRGFDPLSVRFALMENRYRSQMDLSWDSIAAADRVLDRWRSIASHNNHARSGSLSDELDEEMTRVRDEIVTYFATDLDSPRAIQRLRVLEKDREVSIEDKARLLRALDPLLGLNLTSPPRQSNRELSDEDRTLLADRIKAREDRDFQESDRIRGLLSEHGIEVRDLPGGQEWHWR
jgi:cysteinyl-tRNA synthetase